MTDEMAAGTQAQPEKGRTRRRSPRFQIQSPLDVTVLRSGVPDKLPGRALNAGETGLAAILAGELALNETVAIELQGPPNALRLWAVVRYQDKLTCGLEFVGLTPEQRAALRDWVKENNLERELTPKAKPEKPQGQKKTERKSAVGKATIFSDLPPQNNGRRRRITWIVVLALLAISAFLLWWRWNRAWEELEAASKNPSVLSEKPQVQVPAEVMEKLLLHRVEPTYPPEARRENLQGIIAIDIVVGRDGSVVSMKALNGPDVLARAAMDALRWWKFEPFRVNGEAAVAETTVAVEFRR
jgi:TonB family protein